MKSENDNSEKYNWDDFGMQKSVFTTSNATEAEAKAAIRRCYLMWLHPQAMYHQIKHFLRNFRKEPITEIRFLFRTIRSVLFTHLKHW